MPRRRRGNGEGTITQRPDGTWMGQITAAYDPQTRKQDRKTVYGQSAREVREKLDALRGQLAEEQDGGRQTFTVFFKFWLGAQKQKIGPTSLVRYQKDIALLTDHLGRRQLRDLTALHVLKMYEALEAAGHSADARYKAGVRLRQALKVAADAGWVQRNVAKLVPLPRVERGEIRPLRPEEVPAFLLAAAGRRLEALLVLALDTGARLGELLALEWSDWNPATREVNICKGLKQVKQGDKWTHVVGPLKTGSSRRKVMLSAHASQALTSHRERMVREGHGAAPIFCTRTGRHMWPGNIQVSLLAYVTEEAGLPRMRFHDLRHTCATLLLMAGVDIKTIAARLGHANAKQLLQTYAHVLPAMHGRAAAVMDGFLSPTAPAAPQREEAPAPVLKIAEVS